MNRDETKQFREFLERQIPKETEDKEFLETWLKDLKQHKEKIF